MENFYESYNLEQDIENFAMMDDRDEIEDTNPIESKIDFMKYPFSSY